jgi:hypothetical protein
MPSVVIIYPTRKDTPMDASTTRMFTLPRVIALALITLLVAGLAYLRFAPDSSSVSVAEGACAGRSHLGTCDYPTDRVDAVSVADMRSVGVKRESSIGAGMR